MTTPDRTGGSIPRWRRRATCALGVAATSISLCLIVLWARSGRGDALQVVGPLGVELISDDGFLRINHYENWPQPRPAPAHRRSDARFYYDPGPNAAWRYDGEGIGGRRLGPLALLRGHVLLEPTTAAPVGATGVQVRHVELVVPYWLFLCITLPLPLWMTAVLVREVMHRRRARRLGAAVCAGCGYDLRATPTRCPECGRVPAVAAPAPPAPRGVSH